ncbi:MAG: peptidase M15 [Prevotella sp.]|nr:peptidase M15 [Prevotella sp.]
MSNPIDLNRQLSEHFRLREFIDSGTARRLNIDNTPEPVHVERLRQLCLHVLEPLRRRFGVIRVTSGYRCPRLNEAVGGVRGSQHLLGEAADIHISDMATGCKMFEFIRTHSDFDQLLFEHRLKNGCCWLHVSHRSDRGPNRHDARNMYV